jgi:hypothetical protein
MNKRAIAVVILIGMLASAGMASITTYVVLENQEIVLGHGDYVTVRCGAPEPVPPPTFAAPVTPTDTPRPTMPMSTYTPTSTARPTGPPVTLPGVTPGAH